MKFQTSIQIELIKLRRPGNIILLGLMLLILFLLSFGMLKLSVMEGGRALYESFFNRAATQAHGVVTFFLTLFIMMNIGKEFSERTLRKNIIDGVSRDEFYIGKLLILIVASLFAFLLVPLIFLIQGVVSGHLNEAISLFTPLFLITSFAKIVLSGIFGFCLIWFTQSLTASIVIYFFWGIVEQLIIKLQLVIESINVGLENYLPLSAIERMLSMNEEMQPAVFIVPMLYTFFMLFIPYLLLMKRDIK